MPDNIGRIALIDVACDSPSTMPKWKRFLPFSRHADIVIYVSAATAQKPRRLRELDNKMAVGIALGPHVGFPNAYFHLSGKLLVVI